MGREFDNEVFYCAELVPVKIDPLEQTILFYLLALFFQFKAVIDSLLTA